MEIKINVETAGTIPSIIPLERRWKITQLSIAGNLNGTDIDYLRTMGGGYSSGSYSWDHDRKTPGPLETLDLSRANIVSGGLPYKHTEYFDGRTQRSSIEDYFKYQGDSQEFQGSRDGHVYGSKNITSNNVISNEMFLGCWRLVNIILPNNVTRIDDITFLDCWHLTNLYIGEKVNSIGSHIFYSCGRIKEIHIRCLKPPTLKENTFSSYNFKKENCKLFVPKGTMSAYWMAWGFDNIFEE